MTPNLTAQNNQTISYLDNLKLWLVKTGIGEFTITVQACSQTFISSIACFVKNFNFSWNGRLVGGPDLFRCWYWNIQGNNKWLNQSKLQFEGISNLMLWRVKWNIKMELFLGSNLVINCQCERWIKVFHVIRGWRECV